MTGGEHYNNPTSHLIDYLASQGVDMREDPFVPKDSVVKESENNQKENHIEETQQELKPEVIQTPESVEVKVTNQDNTITIKPEEIVIEEKPKEETKPSNNDNLEILEF